MSNVVGSLEEIKKYLCSGNPVWDVDEVAAVMSEAIEAVEKRTAKKPSRGFAYAQWFRMKLINAGKTQEANRMVDCCPSCGRGFNDLARKYPYCKHCGQKIDWKGREENGLDG